MICLHFPEMASILDHFLLKQGISDKIEKQVKVNECF